MKRALALMCAALLLLTLSGCVKTAGGFDAQTEGIVDVKVEREGSHWDEPGAHWYTLASGGQIMDAEPFEPDDMTVCDARGCFKSYID